MTAEFRQRDFLSRALLGFLEKNSDFYRIPLYNIKVCFSRYYNPLFLQYLFRPFVGQNPPAVRISLAGLHFCRNPGGLAPAFLTYPRRFKGYAFILKARRYFYALFTAFFLGYAHYCHR